MIFAFALFAVFLDYCGETAITAIVITAAVVVSVIAVAVPFVFQGSACSGTTVGVQALALLAVFFDNRLPEGASAAITAIIFTTAIVVVVVAVAVPFVFLGSARPGAGTLLSGIFARAILAVLCSFVRQTAITAIVSAAAVVVLIVAVAIRLVVRVLATPKAGGATLILGVFALAFLAILGVD